MIQSAFDLLSKIKYFASAMCLFGLIAGILLLSFGYVGSFNLLNTPFHPEGDYFFPFITLLGDASVLLAFFVLFYWKEKPMQVIVLIISIIISGIIVQVMKRYIFDDMLRPVARLGEEVMSGRYYEYPGIPVERLNSFPSGHSVTIVAGMTIWAFRTGSAFYQLVLASIALLVMQSRIYMGVHFLGDVTASALIGFLVSFRVYLSYTLTKDKYNIYQTVNKFISHPLARQAGIGIAIGVLLVNLYVKIIYIYFIQ